MAFLIDTYNRFDSWDRAHSVHTFRFHDSQYAIKLVELENGVPQFPERIEAGATAYPTAYKLYDTLEDALAYVQLLKSIN